MTPWALLADSFFGLSRDLNTETAERTWKFIAAPEPWLVFFLVVGAVAFAGWIYRRENRSVQPGWRAVCGGMRALAILLLLLILFQPALVSERYRMETRIVVALLDSSLSMNFTDTYESEDDRRELAAGLGLLNPGDPVTPDITAKLESMPRIDIVNQLLERHADATLRLLARDNDLKVFTFDSVLTEAEKKPNAPVTGNPYQPLESAPDTGLYTRLGSAMEAIADKYPAQKLGGVILITDGRSNSGPDPEDVASGLDFGGVPLYCVGVGDYHEPKDVELLNLQAPERVQIKVTASLSAEIKAVNFEGRECAATLRILQHKRPGEAWEDDDRVLDSQTVTLPDNETKGRLTFTHKFLENELGQYRMRMELNAAGSPAELPGEITKNNNAVEFMLEVISDKLRILYLEGYPRWEYRYLKNGLIRDRDNLEVQVFLFSADANFAQECSDGLDPIVDFQQELLSLEALAEYDCVILGDVNPALLPAEFRQNLVDFVTRLNGGLIFVAGEFYMPRAYTDTPIYSLLPILIDDSGAAVYDETIEHSFHPELTAEGRASAVTRMTDDTDRNVELWEDNDKGNDGLPGWFWYFRNIERASPGATVLVQHPADTAKNGEKMPIIVSAQVGSGFVLYVGTDDIWRWRWLVDDLYMYPFYRNAITFATGGRLQSSKRFSITTNKDSYDQNDKIEISVTALDRDLRPFRDPASGETLPAYPVTLHGPNHAEPVTLSLDLGSDKTAADTGRYIGAFKATQTGTWRAEVRDMNPASGEEPEHASKSFDVFTKSLEDKHPKMDQELLRAIAARTGGRFFYPWQLPELSKFIESGKRPVKGATITDTLWDSGFFMLLALVLLCVEWSIRKWKQLT